jgi:hypothetical protein
VLMNKFALTKKRMLISVIAICIVAISGLTLWLNARPVAQAAVLNPHPGLVGWWRFDEGSGTIAIDSSGYGNNGTIYGATYVAGKYGDALSFNGTTYAGINSINLPFSTAYSVSVWVNPSAYAGMFLFGRINDANWYVAFGSGGTITDWATGSALDWNPNVPYVTGQWQNFVFLYNGTNKLIYRNGVLAASTTQASTAGSGLYVGRYGGYTTGEFQGVVDEVQIYNRALSTAEIQAGFQVSPDVSANILAKVPKGTTQVITTLSWQGTGSINVTIVSPSQSYNESVLPEYQRTTYSTSSGTSIMLNIKRVSVSVSALLSDQNWNIMLTLSNVSAYQITVEVQK